jgi:hypothetical protein
MNYRQLTPDMHPAWLAYKKAYSGAGKPSLVSFIAGWNASNKT